MVRAVFGPSALVTPANAVTIGRLTVTPVMLALIVADGESWGALVAWILLAGTDGVDGFLARRHGTTRAGAFLDPLADKVLVLSAMVTLVVDGVFWWLPVTLIAGREVAMSVYRAVMGRQGVSIPARRSAKAKTVLQAVAVGFALLPPAADDPWVATSVLWAAVVLTVVSGMQYLVDGRRVPHAV